MRFVSAAVAAIFLGVSSFGAFAATTPSFPGVKAESTFELIKSGKKSTKKAKKGKKAKKAKGGKGPGHCGTGQYWSKGKCEKASAKKSKEPWKYFK